MAVMPHPPRLPAEPSDKIQHAIAFFVLGLLSRLAYPRARAAMLLAGLSLFGAAIELFQAIPALHRDCEFADWVTDTVAAGSALLIIGRPRCAKLD